MSSFIYHTNAFMTCYEGLNITRLTRTQLLVSVALDSELSADSSFICTHTILGALGLK